MTDKQIMIDGVDVSGCISLDKYYIPNCTEEFIDCALGGLYEYQDEYKRTCKENPNCYYKQLARKEQECKELKKQLERKEENYQKLLNKSNKYIHNLVDENVQDISNLARQLDQLKAENEKLKKILTEIKKIVEQGVKIHDDIIVSKQILQKISEVL